MHCESNWTGALRSSPPARIWRTSFRMLESGSKRRIEDSTSVDIENSERHKRRDGMVNRPAAKCQPPDQEIPLKTQNAVGRKQTKLTRANALTAIVCLLKVVSPVLVTST